MKPLGILLVLYPLAAHLFLWSGYLIETQIYLLIYLPPTILPLILLVVFLRSLTATNTPIITQFAIKIEGKLSVEKQLYTKNITKLWVIIFAFMVGQSIILAILAPLTVWSWATHIGNYILIALVIVAEFFYRQWRFGSNKMGIWRFIITLMTHKI